MENKVSGYDRVLVAPQRPSWGVGTMSRRGLRSLQQRPLQCPGVPGDVTPGDPGRERRRPLLQTMLTGTSWVPLGPPGPCPPLQEAAV